MAAALPPGPLEGVRVLEFTEMLLANVAADVIKVEPDVAAYPLDRKV